ncbi:MAG: multicopper oxidase domain-containing protein [Methylococcales bacterium]
MNSLVKVLVLAGCLSLLLLTTGYAMTMQHHGMTMDDKGMIMNENTHNLPKDCPKISGDVNITIRAGHKHATKFNGKMFAFDQQQWEVAGCSRINITFINDDQIRHQLMIHGLPGYLYSDGMFTMEIYGKGEKKASLIVPSDPKTYLVHCEVPQHMEKGMKAQLKVAGGDGDLPSIPGVSPPVKGDSYLMVWNTQAWLILLLAILAGLSILFFFKKLKK